jgi:hypothetical protein
MEHFEIAREVDFVVCIDGKALVDLSATGTLLFHGYRNRLV